MRPPTRERLGANVRIRRDSFGSLAMLAAIRRASSMSRSRRLWDADQSQNWYLQSHVNQAADRRLSSNAAAELVVQLLIEYCQVIE
jgi:hypothetical protein